MEQNQQNQAFEEETVKVGKYEYNGIVGQFVKELFGNRLSNPEEISENKGVLEILNYFQKIIGPKTLNWVKGNSITLVGNVKPDVHNNIILQIDYRGGDYVDKYDELVNAYIVAMRIYEKIYIRERKGTQEEEKFIGEIKANGNNFRLITPPGGTDIKDFDFLRKSIDELKNSTL